ncbi:MAG: PHP-associated domain-containing protein [Chloroflexota bacterium]
MYSKADTHMHTTCSDGLMTPEETIDYIVEHTDLRVVAVTDHDTAEGGLIAHDYAQRYAGQLDVIVGQEVTTLEGDVVGLFVNRTLPIYDTALEAIGAIHAQGGLAVAVHPFSRIVSGGNMHGVTTKIFHLPFDAMEARNGFPTNVLVHSLSSWLNRKKGQNLPELGGSDSHVSYTIGHTFSWFPGQTASDFRQAVLEGTVRAGGICWSPMAVARAAVRVIKNGGIPKYDNAIEPDRDLVTQRD